MNGGSQRMKIRDSLRIGLIMTAVLTLLLAGWAAAETIPDPAQSEAEAFLESQKAAAQKDASADADAGKEDGSAQG